MLMHFPLAPVLSGRILGVYCSLDNNLQDRLLQLRWLRANREYSWQSAISALADKCLPCSYQQSVGPEESIRMLQVFKRLWLKFVDAHRLFCPHWYGGNQGRQLTLKILEMKTDEFANSSNALIWFYTLWHKFFSLNKTFLEIWQMKILCSAFLAL